MDLVEKGCVKKEIFISVQEGDYKPKRGAEKIGKFVFCATSLSRMTFMVYDINHENSK